MKSTLSNDIRTHALVVVLTMYLASVIVPPCAWAALAGWTGPLSIRGVSLYTVAVVVFGVALNLCVERTLGAARHQVSGGGGKCVR